MTKVKKIRLEQDVQDTLDVIDTTGTGSKFLNDAWSYEEVGGGWGLSDAQSLVDDTFILWEDCSEVFEIEDQDFAKIQAGTHKLEWKELVEVPVFIEPMPEFLEETESEQNIEEDVIKE